MAKATVIQLKPVKQPPKKIILELSEGEADFIYAVTHRVAGSPTASPRKYSERVHAALKAALGIDGHQTDAHRLMSNASRIYFNEYPDGFREDRFNGRS